MTADVVVTGRGVVSSIGESPDAFFEALLAKRSGIADGIGACVDFDPEVAMSPKEARRSDRYTQLAVAAAMQAAEEAGLPDGVDPERLGVLVGTGVGGLATLQNECQAWLEGGDRAVSPHFVPMMMPNAAAGTIAMRLGAHGPGFSVSSACATGGHAIGEAARMIARGEVDAVVAGGTEAALTGLCIAAFKRMGALSREGVSRPFDVERDGFVMGEGAGVLVLEREEHAKARGAEILARIAGYGASNDAFHITHARGERPRRLAGDARRARRRGRLAERRGLHQRPRHLDAVQRQDRDARDQAGVQRLVDAARRCPRRSRTSATCSAPPAPWRRSCVSKRCAAVYCPRRSTTSRPTRTAISITCPRGPARHQGSSWRCRTPSDSADRTRAWP